MDFMCFAVLILLMFHIEESTECNTDDIAAFTGCNVSIKWTLRNISNEVLKFNIYNSLENLTASYSISHDCRVSDNSSTSCKTNESDDVLIILLTIFNVTERQSGIYKLQQMDATKIQRTSFTNVTLIGKPKVIPVQKPILGQRFEMTCSSSHEQECYIYRWKINGTVISSVHNVNSHYVSSLRMTDNFNNVTCQVCLNETANTFPSVICEPDRCSVDSDPYSIQIAYGPDNISLSSREHDKRNEENMRVIGMGLVGVAVLLVVIGCLLVRQWRKNASNTIDSKSPHELVMNLRTLTTGDTSQGTSRIQNRHLPDPNTHEATIGGLYRPKYPNHKRKSRSLHNLLDSVQDSFHPLRSDLSLQVLYSPSNIMGRGLRSGNQGYNSIKGKCCSSSNYEENQLGDMSVLENGIKLEFLYAKVRKDRETGAQSGKLNNLPNESFEEEPQENPYSTIDEDALPVFDDAISNSMSENSSEEQMNNRHEESDNDFKFA